MMNHLIDRVLLALVRRRWRRRVVFSDMVYTAQVEDMQAEQAQLIARAEKQAMATTSRLARKEFQEVRCDGSRRVQ